MGPPTSPPSPPPPPPSSSAAQTELAGTEGGGGGGGGEGGGGEGGGNVDGTVCLKGNSGFVDVVLLASRRQLSWKISCGSFQLRPCYF